ncbi:MAG: site-2 protease family protein [Ardenticatenaceae bacterium]|nr:site-2 protease family protein [Ardenticatenaceae bacterium]
MSILWMIGGFFIVLTPIVLVHELGHFWAAKKSGIRVEEFGLGLPPRAAKLAEKNGTIYSLNWIPLGGFVRPAGEDDPTVPGGLAGASKRARFFVLVAGSTANFIMAILVFWIAFMIGPPTVDGSRVAVLSVFEDSPAAAAGLVKGDTILAVNGMPVTNDMELVTREVSGSNGQPVTMLLERNGQEIETVLQPAFFEAEDSYMIGISLGHPLSGQRDSMGPGESAVESVRFIGDYVTLFFRVPGMLVRGEISARDARPVSIVGISQIAGQAAESSADSGSLFPILSMIAFINVALGLTNLLPIPALDGGRILFVIIEAIRGRRIEPERESMVHIIGMAVLLGLMVLLIVQDLVNPIIPF